MGIFSVLAAKAVIFFVSSKPFFPVDVLALPLFAIIICPRPPAGRVAGRPLDHRQVDGAGRRVVVVDRHGERGALELALARRPGQGSGHGIGCRRGRWSDGGGDVGGLLVGGRRTRRRVRLVARAAAREGEQHHDRGDERRDPSQGEHGEMLRTHGPRRWSPRLDSVRP